jgi:hypothetical protein
VWSTAYHEILYLRRAKPRDFLNIRFCAPAVVYKYTQTATLLSYRRQQFCLDDAISIPPVLIHVAVQPRLGET